MDTDSIPTGVSKGRHVDTVRIGLLWWCVLALASIPCAAGESQPRAPAGVPYPGDEFHAESAASEGSVDVIGHRIDYRAIAGTLVVHPKDWDDAKKPAGDNKVASGKQGDEAAEDAEASIFYVAYFKRDARAADRPVTFLYNGGPGSSTIWLHMGAFGPRRVLTQDHRQTPAAPYSVIANTYSLLDVTDLVFIDAPGTGFSRVRGKDKEKAFYGVDADAYAFSQFIQDFLSKYARWNSPKFLLGESYGTTRSAVLVNELATSDHVDVNGVIMLSQILNFDLDPDQPELNPGTDESYIVALPTYAAAARYHDRSGGVHSSSLDGYLREVEQFATTDYALALQAGAELDDTRRQTVANRLAQYTGLPLAYVLKANLRIDMGEFAKTLQAGDDLTTGQLDARFSGPSMDPLSKVALYDPQIAAIASAYVSSLNTYVRETLGFGQGQSYLPESDLWQNWSYDHRSPGQTSPTPSILNVMPDLASAMKYNTRLKVMINGGCYDLNTPFFEGWYEGHHLQIPSVLQDHIEYHYYESGHMIYAHEASLKELHDNIADFIRRSVNLQP